MAHQSAQLQSSDSIGGLVTPRTYDFESGPQVTFLDRSTLTLPPAPLFDPLLGEWTCPETGGIGIPMSALAIAARIIGAPSQFGNLDAERAQDIYTEGTVYSEIAEDVLSSVYRDGYLLRDPENFKDMIEETFRMVHVTRTDEGLVALVPVPATDRGDVCGEFADTDYEFVAAIDKASPFTIHLSADKNGSVVWRKGHKSQGRGVIRHEDEILIEHGITYAERARLRNEMSSVFFSHYYREAIQTAYDAFVASETVEQKAGPFPA